MWWAERTQKEKAKAGGLATIESANDLQTFGAAKKLEEESSPFNSTYSFY
jgi:hypothetical protein